MKNDFINQIIPNVKVDADFKSLKIGDVGFTNDFANVSTSATPTQWAPELSFGIRTNNGVQELSDFIAPQAPTSLSAFNAYNYKYYPTGNAIVASQDAKKYERGVGGEFQFVSTTTQLKSATMRNIGVSMILEKRMSENDPSYKARNFAYLSSLISMVELTHKINALDTIAEPLTWKPADGDFNLLIEESLQTQSDKIGLDLNRLVFGQKAWSIYHSALGDGDKASNFAYFSETPESFGARQNVSVMNPSARLKDSAGNYPRFAASSVYGFVQKGVGDDGLSNLLTFTDGRDQEMNTFDHPQKQLEIITVSKWFDVAVVVADGVFKINVTK